MSPGRDQREEPARRAVRAIRPPDEDEALERALLVAAGEHRERARPLRRRSGLKLAGATIAAALAAALFLTPAGADVRDWVADAINDDATVERRALTRLPSGGDVLVTSKPGTWVVHEDGSRRLLGDYDDATFSPRGLFVAGARENTLTAVDPEGEVRWSISRRGAVSDPVWAPSGYRIAFRQGDGIGIVAGDGTAARSVAYSNPVAPTWRPSSGGTDPRTAPNELTYVTGGPRPAIATIEADSRRVIWRRQAGRRPLSIIWAGPDRLVATYRHEVRLLGRDGRYLESVRTSRRARVESTAVSADGDRLAVVLSNDSVQPRSRLLLARIAGDDRDQRTVFSGSGRFGEAVWSPDGRRILLPWLDTDQWLFVSPAQDRKLVRRVIAIGDIATQFDPGGREAVPQPPQVRGWCCG